MSEIVVVIDQTHCVDMNLIAGQLTDAGMEISCVNKDEGVIEGLVESSKVKAIDEMPGVDYVRTVFTYAANYPPGDPRDRDNT